MSNPRKSSNTDPDKTSLPSADKKKVEIQIEALSTPKGDVPTVKSLERVVDGLNILDSELSEATDEIRKDIVSKMKDLERDVISIKKLVSEMAISLEATSEKLTDVEPKLEKTFETIESQKMESAELARYIGAVTNNLRREFVDYFNLLERKLTDEIKKIGQSEASKPVDYGAKLDELQASADKKAIESLKMSQETKKTVADLREDIKDLVGFLGDTLAGFSHKLEGISKLLSNVGSPVEGEREAEKMLSERTKNAKAESSREYDEEDEDADGSRNKDT